MIYEQLTNKEFISLTQNGRTDEVYEHLLHRFRPYIRMWISKHYKSLKMEFDDLESIAFKELWTAYKKFDPTHYSKCSFLTYFIHYMKNAMKREDTFNKHKKRSGKEMVSLSMTLYEDGDTAITVEDSLTTDNWRQEYEDVDTKIFIETQIHPRLQNEKDRRVFGLLLNGYIESEISEILGVSRQAINQRVKRIRERLQWLDWRHLLFEA